jgi:hypothetical protein
MGSLSVGIDYGSWRLTGSRELYPHRPRLWQGLKFLWQISPAAIRDTDHNLPAEYADELPPTLGFR